MKPAQKFLLSCRQASEASARLVDWLEANPGLLGAGRVAVREDIDAQAARLMPLAAAAETPPGIGLLATPGAAKTDLLFHLLATRMPTTLGELGQRPLDTATIRGLLPQDNDAGGAVVIRFSSAELPPAPRGYPIRVGLLSMIDVAAVVTRAADSATMLRGPAPSPAAIGGLFEAVSGRLSPQAVPGLSERDVLDLRETLNTILPGHRTLAALAASRYWEQFREVAPHISERDRRLVLAVLWHDNATFSALFNRLCDGLDRLGQGADAYCPPEALLGKDKSSGWTMRHPRSIIHAATLLALDQHAGPVLNVMNRYGQSVDIERAVMAALVAELPLHLGSSRLNELAPAEILDFPVAPPIGSHRPALGDDQLARAVDHYARAKAIYLFERACVRRDVTSLVVVASPDVEDDTYACAIGDWVDGAQGATAHARERVRRGLFVAAALPPGRRPTHHGDGDGAARMLALIRDVIGHDQDWPQAWTPGRGMGDVFWFEASEATTAPPATPQGTALATLLPAAPTGLMQDDTVAELVRDLAHSCDIRTKHLQLGQSLIEVRRRLRATVLRHHASNDPAALNDWRRGTAVVVQNRLQYLISQGRLGHLLRALLPREDDLIRAIETAALSQQSPLPAAGPSMPPWPRTSQAVPLSMPVPQVAFPAAPGGGPEQAGRMADVALAHWLKEMRRAARSPRLCRDLKIEPAILHNLIDELQIGALRVALGSEIANAYAKSATPVALADGFGASVTAGDRADSVSGAVRLAAYACRIINAYLEVLSAPQGRLRGATPRPGRGMAADLDVADGAASGYGSSAVRSRGVARRALRPAQQQWEISFVNLVDDNISSAHLLVGRGDKDRELGELIALFASGPFEVDP